MKENEGRIVRLFFVKTELERLVADVIASSYGDGSVCYLFGYKEKLLNDFLWEGWKNRLYLDLKEKRGLLAGQRTAMSHMLKIEEFIDGDAKVASEINIYLARLKNSNSNYAIHFIKNTYIQSLVNVNIIPHGASNFISRKLTDFEVKKMKRKNNFLIGFLYPRLKYYAFSGDHYGMDDNSVVATYTLPGHIVDHQKVKAMDFSHFKKSTNNESGGSKDALILGQIVLGTGRVTQENIDKIDLKIKKLISEHEIDNVYFLPHPREDGTMCFYNDTFKIIDNTDSMEMLLLKRKFGLIISSFSTGLFTSKIILGDSCKVYAVGVNLIDISKDEIEELIKAFEAVGVNIINV